MRRHKIDILEVTRTKDADGFSIDTWNPISSTPLWANVIDQGSREFYASNAEVRSHIIRCNIAYRSDVTDSMRIRWKGKDYQIIRAYNGDYRQNGIDLDGELIEGSVD